MRNVLLLALALATVSTPTLGAASDAWIVLRDTPDGFLASRSASIDAVLCDGDAPTRPACVLDPLPSRSYAVALPSGFTLAGASAPAHRMRLTAILASATTERTFACDVSELPAPAPAGTGGAIDVRCHPGLGPFPPPGAPVRLDVVAFALLAGGSAEPSTPLDAYRATGGEVVVAGVGRFVVTAAP